MHIHLPSLHSVHIQDLPEVFESFHYVLQDLVFVLRFDKYEYGVLESRVRFPSLLRKTVLGFHGEPQAAG